MADEWSRLCRVEGFFTQMNYAIWRSLFSFQERNQINGNLFEIGTWKGRSAAALTLHCRQGERVVLCDFMLDDLNVVTNLETLGFNARCITPIAKRSSELKPSDLAGLERTVRWFHIDGDHSAEMTYLDLKVADRILSDEGVVVVDDFFNARYVSVAWATFSYLSNQRHSFRLFLAGDNKGYLCRPHATRKYREHVLAEIPATLSGSQLALHQSGSIFDCEALGLGASWIEERTFIGLDEDQTSYETVEKARWG